MLDELHRRAEERRRGRVRVRAADGRTEVRSTVEVCVDPRIRRVRFDARLVQPEGVARRELHEFPLG